MSDSPSVNITINGRPVQARPGQTVLQAAAAAGVTIPSLCNHPHLRPEGSCRVCLVEIEKQRTLQPACTFPVSDGLVIHTESEKVVNGRVFALQMLFSERSHYCMYCPMSGTVESTDCELQRLGYKYNLNFWEFAPNYAKSWPLDATRKYFVMDHSRCILCRRCVRACSAIAANHTLGVGQRGTRSMICADDNLPFGESSCISCGTCLEVCPTGALMDRRSAYMGNASNVQRTPGVCIGCAVACSAEVITRDNQLLRVESDWSGPGGGLLCSIGRFETVEPRPDRILRPLVRQNGKQVETRWDIALSVVASHFRQAGLVCGLASPRMTSESLAAFAFFFQEALRSDEVGLLSGEVPPLDIGTMAALSDLPGADCIVVIGGDPLREQKVLGSLIRQAWDRGARLFVVNDKPTDLDPFAHVLLHLEDISHAGQSPFEHLMKTYHLGIDGVVQLKQAVESAQRPIVLYGDGLSTTVYAALRGMPRKVRFLPLVNGTNAAGAARLGLQTRTVKGDAVYVLLGDELPDGHPVPKRQFTVIQAAYRSRWTNEADVVLPAPIWAEQKGHVINLEGRSRPIQPLLQAPDSVHSNCETLLRLASQMGCTLSQEQIAEISLAG